jgi:hypothetical protein
VARVNTIGIEVPEEFPYVAYEAVHDRLRDLRLTYPIPWREYSGGWNAVASRFTMALASEQRFIVSIRANPNPSHEERQLQEESLFGFFVAGLATIDSFAYATFAIGAMLRPDSFPVERPENLRAIGLESLGRALAGSFPQAELAGRVSALPEDDGLRRWRDIRNILAHRTLPARHHHAGGALDGVSEWVVIDRIPINEHMTAGFHGWLVSQVSACVEALDRFTANNFP